MFVLASIVFLFGTAQAADVCKGVRFKEDPFAGGDSALEVVQAMSQFAAASVVLELKAGKTELTISTKEFGAQSGNVQAGIEVPFRFADGTVLTLATARETQRSAYVTDTQVMTISPLTFALDAAALEAFSSSALTVARVPTAAGPWDWEPNGGLQKKLQAVALCFKSKTSP